MKQFLSSMSASQVSAKSHADQHRWLCVATVAPMNHKRRRADKTPVVRTSISRNNDPLRFSSVICHESNTAHGVVMVCVVVVVVVVVVVMAMRC